MIQFFSKTSCHARGFSAVIQEWIFSVSDARLKGLGVLFVCFGISTAAAQPKQVSIPDTTARKGDTVLVPIRVASLATSDSVYSGQFSISFDGTVIDIFDIVATGTLTQSASPVYNNTTRKFAFASSSILTGSGVLVYLKVRALASPARDTTSIFFPDTAFNEGKPKIALTRGKFRILRIVLSPKSPSSTVIVGDTLQFSTSGDQQLPLTWTSTDTAVGKINSTGRLITSGVGQMKVHVQDNQGLRDSSNLFAVYPAIARNLTVSVQNSSFTQTLQFNMPVYVSDVTSLGVLSSQFTLSFSSSHLQAMDVVQAGSMTAAWSQPIFSIVAGQINVALAGSQALTGSGVLVYVRFRVQGGASGSSNVTFSNVIFNENLNANVVNAVFTPLPAPTVVITPNTATLTKTDTLRFKVTSGGTPPYTWTSGNPTVASIHPSSGLLTAQSRGTTTVTVVDNLGFSRTTGSIVINDLMAIVPDTAMFKLDTIGVPIRIGNVTGLGILSFEARIVYDSTILRFVNLQNSGTLSSGFTIEYKDTLDTLRIVGAGTSVLSGQGNLILMKFRMGFIQPNQIGKLTSPLNLAYLSLNEGIPSATLRSGSLRPLPLLVSMSVSPRDTSLYVGQTLQFTATGTFQDAGFDTVSELMTRFKKVNWSSSAPTVLSIDSNGIATGNLASGTPAQIIATSGSISAQTNVRVLNPATLSSIVVSPNDTTVMVGDSLQYTATGIFSDLSTRVLASSEVTWGATPGARVTIDGNGFARVPGTATVGTGSITATAGLISDLTNLYVVSFTAPATPILSSPTDGATGLARNPRLKWLRSLVTSSYRVQLSTSSSFATTIIDSSGVKDSSIIFPGLAALTTHYWRVSATNAAGTSAFSSAWQFTTGTSTSVDVSELLPTDFALGQNYPNPFNPSTTIQFSIPTRSFVRLSVFSLLGTDIATLVSTELNAGVYERNFDAAFLASGVYFYRLESRPIDSNSRPALLTRKMLLLK